VASDEIDYISLLSLVYGQLLNNHIFVDWRHWGRQAGATEAQADRAFRLVMNLVRAHGHYLRSEHELAPGMRGNRVERVKCMITGRSYVVKETERHSRALKTELRATFRLRHRNWVRWYDLRAVDVDTPLFGETRRTSVLMEFIDGQTFAEYAGRVRSGPDGWSLIRRAFRELCEGVRAIHKDAAMLHRDLKSDNVLVENETARVVILDFGMATQLGPGESKRTSTQGGTELYMSPEQMSGELELPEESDWYAVGTMLFEALTGELPFPGTGPLGHRARLVNEAPSPSDRGVLPGHLDDLVDLCSSLLRRDPAQRPSWRSILEVVKSDGRRAQISVSRMPKMRGREEEHRTLIREFGRSKEGETAVVRITGESGFGKTELLDAFSQSVEGHATFLRGQCYDVESISYQGLDSVITDLGRKLNSGKHEFESADRDALGQLFPELIGEGGDRNRTTFESVDLGAVARKRRLASIALRRLLSAVGGDKTAVVLIDDLQWGDSESAWILADALATKGRGLLVVLASREGGAFPKTFEQAMRSCGLKAVDISLKPLHPSARLQIVHDLAGPGVIDDEMAKPIVEESQGDPIMLVELTRFVLNAPDRSGVLGGLSWSQVILERIERSRREHCAGGGLDPLRLLQLLAIAGRPLEDSIAYELSNCGEAEYDTLRWNNFTSKAESSLGERTLQPYHDRIAGVIRESLDRETVKQWHRDLAKILSDRKPKLVAEIAAHWEGAEEFDKAAERFEEAGKEAYDKQHFALSASLHRRAVKLRPRDVDLIVRYGDALKNAGQTVDAARQYLDAADLVEGDSRRAGDLHVDAALQFLQTGNMMEAGRFLRSGLRSSRLSIHRHRSVAIAEVLLLFVAIGLQRTLRFGSLNRERDLRESDRCWGLAGPMGMIDNLHGYVFQKRHLLLALKLKEPYRMSKALSVEGVYAACLGVMKRRRAMSLLGRAEEQYRKVKDPALRAHAKGFHIEVLGATGLLFGEWQYSLDHFEECIRHFHENKCVDVHWELDTAHSFSIWLLFLMGRVRRLRDELRDSLGAVRKRGVIYAEVNMATLGEHIVDLADDKPESDAIERLEETREKWEGKVLASGQAQNRAHIQRLLWLVSITQVHLYHGKGAEAWACFEANLPTLLGKWTMRIQVLNVLLVHGRARACLMQLDSQDGKKWARRARSLARRLERYRSPWSTALSQSVVGLLKKHEGRAPEAKRHLEAAVEGFDSTDMTFHAAACRRVLADISDNPEELLRSWRSWMRENGIENWNKMTRVLMPDSCLSIPSSGEE
jgi:serine/threonine protein kinase/tetratricopeptide (TPR) repeat protein